METLLSVSQRVLVVDDEPANVELLRQFLIDIADEIVCLTDSKAAEQTFIEFAPDLVVLDLHMPDPDGLEILRRLRSARENRGFIPVIVLTADDRNVARNSAFLLGANDFLADVFGNPNSSITLTTDSTADNIVKLVQQLAGRAHGQAQRVPVRPRALAAARRRASRPDHSGRLGSIFR